MKNFRDLVDNRVAEKLNSASDVRRKIQIKVIAELMNIVEQQLVAEIEKAPFNNEYYFLLDGEEIRDKQILNHCMNIAERGYSYKMDNGTSVAVSVDIECIRVDVTISDEY